ncbi:MAG: hypothetical protein AAF726_20605 [Planctomycetota bacterium]
MPKTKKFQCFVAMAFGRKDADAVYSKLIKPTARSLDLTCTRVDQKEHNRNINDVIAEEIGRANVVIADLTYARPSVYFEAGLAEARIRERVIYTVRRDHLKPRDDDPERNLAVHFDVSMRNMIGWNDPSDVKFGEKLAKRLRHVLRPIERERARDRARDASREDFGKLSGEMQLDQMLAEATSSLRRAKLRKAHLGELDLFDLGRLDGMMPRLALATARKGNHVTYVGIAPRPSLTPARIPLATSYWDESLAKLLGRAKHVGDRKTVSKVHDHLIFCSPKIGQMARIRERYEQAHVGSDPRCLVFPESRTLLRKEGYSFVPPEELAKRRDAARRQHHLWLLGGIQSIPDMREQLEAILSDLD